MGKLISTMFHSRLITTHPALFRKPLAFLCMLPLLAILPAHAAPPKSAPIATPPAPADSAVLTEKPSRYVSPDEIQDYLRSISLNFSMAKRKTDPFGQQQNPDAKPVIKSTLATATRKTTLPSQITPFAEIIRKIRVTTVMPAERRFLVGTRSFKQGDRFPMNFRGRSTDVEITTVNSKEIVFRKLDNDESASLKLSLLPPGMTPGNSTITTPGMIRESANSPLDIEPASTPGNNFLN